ncbi:MAG: hypothetical protein H6685_02230 [Deltaproteobacteria bacterium]|nr:hypothetical protein [Deltaproteobacteria bacterium]
MRTPHQKTLTHLLAIVLALASVRISAGDEVVFEEDFENLSSVGDTVFESIGWSEINFTESHSTWISHNVGDRYIELFGEIAAVLPDEERPTPDSLLISPVIHASGYKSLKLSFGIFSYYGGRKIYFSSSAFSMENLYLLASLEGEFEDDSFSVDFPVGFGNQDFRLVFRATGDVRWFLDNISVTGEPCGDCEELRSDDDDDDSGCGGCVVGSEGGGASGGLAGLALMLVWIAGYTRPSREP